MTNLEIFLLATTLIFLVCYLVQRSIYLTDSAWFENRRNALIEDRNTWRDKAFELLDKIDQAAEEDTDTLKEDYAQQLAALGEESERKFKRMEHAICTLASWDHGQAGAAQIHKLITEG